MDDTTQSSNQATKPEATPANLDEHAIHLVPGKKRAAFEPGEGTGNQNEQDGDATLPSPKRIKGHDSPKETEMSDSKSLGSGPSPAGLPASKEATKAHGGWNQGISGGLRTSFAGKGKLRKPVSQQASESPAQSPAPSIDIDGLTMPSGDAKFSEPGSANAWQARFENWCVRLMALNKDQEGLKDAAVLKEAWGSWLKTQLSLPRSGRGPGVRAASVSRLDSEKLQEMFLEAMKMDPLAPWPEPSTGAESVDADQQSSGQPGSNNSKAASPLGSQATSEWTLPPLQSCDDFEVKHKDQRAWEDKFVGWCKSLIQLNESRIKVGTTRERNRLTETYLKWVGNIDGLSKGKAAAARRAAVHYAQDNSALLGAVFAGTAPGSGSETAEPVTAPQVDSAPSPVPAVSDGAHGQSIEEYRERYFPGVDPDEVFCHMCASRGHNAVDCPDVACRFCQDPQHRSFSCPTRQRCTKCKQLGHTKRDCTEKLALPQDDMECAFCGARDHVDASCHELWRSFSATPDTIRKVRCLPVYCYCCGREGHYGPVCGLNPQKTKQSVWETWSQSNCDQYQDPASSEVAIIFEASAGEGFSSERPDLGKSIVPKRHIFFEEADDDDDEAEAFIRPPVQRNTRGGFISFSSNNNTGGGNRGGRRAGNQYNDRNTRGGYTQQPPLPHGRPPPLPPQRNGRRRGGGPRY